MFPALGDLMARRLADWGPPVDAIVPVPLAGHRLRERGYNQASCWPGRWHGRRARGRARPRARQADEDSRQANVASAYAAGRRPTTGGALLLNDVMTTGSNAGCLRPRPIECWDKRRLRAHPGPRLEAAAHPQ
jgi:predicted amidophosphoribosyltransferase